MKAYKDINSYIQAVPKEAQALLKEMRVTVRKVAPDAMEAISYGIPTYKLNGNLVHFGAFKDHIGFFPTSSGVSAFKKDLTKYHVAKGTIQFPLDKPLPLSLIKKIVAFRVKENTSRTQKGGELPALAAPALRALAHANIKNLRQLPGYTEAELLALHGMGPGSIPKIRAALKAKGLSFKKK